jgi:carbonic anhydrase
MAMQNGKLSSQEALDMLREGNARYAAGNEQRPNQDRQRRSLTAWQGQQPFAVVLACSDSRVPVEILFDRGIGDIFVVRVAGNVVGGTEMGSIEYAVDRLGISLIAVLGHTRCGAVTAVANGEEISGNMNVLAELIAPAVATARADYPGATGDLLVYEAVKANVWTAAEKFFKSSAIIRREVKSGSLAVIGAVYDIESGQVDWMGVHPAEQQLLYMSGLK